MIGQAAKHPEKARVLVRLRMFKPVSPKERTASMAASMSREAKLLPTVLPIEATPTGAYRIMTPCNAMWFRAYAWTAAYTAAAAVVLLHANVVQALLQCIIFCRYFALLPCTR